MTAQDIACPVCGTELDLGVLFAHEGEQRAFARLAEVSLPLGARVLQYITLFTPPKTRLTAAKKLKLILQLLPDMERKAITHRGRDWAAPLSCWAQAIDQMLATRDAGRLDLPMKGHGYLYSILVGLADKVEAVAEVQAEAKARSAPRVDTVQVRGQALPIGAALDVVYGGLDPTLAQMDAHDKRVAAVPESSRAYLAALKKPKPPETP